MKDSVLNYFMFAVRNKRQRRELVCFAYKHYGPKQEFLWCPKKIQMMLSALPNSQGAQEKKAESEPSRNDSETTTNTKKDSVSVLLTEEKNQAETSKESRTTINEVHPPTNEPKTQGAEVGKAENDPTKAESRGKMKTNEDSVHGPSPDFKYGANSSSTAQNPPSMIKKKQRMFKKPNQKARRKPIEFQRMALCKVHLQMPVTRSTKGPRTKMSKPVEQRDSMTDEGRTSDLNDSLPT